MSNIMSAQFLVEFGNAVMVTMKKMFIVNSANYWMNRLKFMKKMKFFSADISDKKFSGKFKLRVDGDLHKTLAIKAMQVNESLNCFFVGKYCGRQSHNSNYKGE